MDVINIKFKYERSGNAPAASSVASSSSLYFFLRYNKYNFYATETNQNCTVIMDCNGLIKSLS